MLIITSLRSLVVLLSSKGHNQVLIRYLLYICFGLFYYELEKVVFYLKFHIISISNIISDPEKFEATILFTDLPWLHNKRVEKTKKKFYYFWVFILRRQHFSTALAQRFEISRVEESLNNTGFYYNLRRLETILLRFCLTQKS